MEEKWRKEKNERDMGIREEEDGERRRGRKHGVNWRKSNRKRKRNRLGRKVEERKE